jgi:tetratricopeptide (TPR) repeat protein
MRGERDRLDVDQQHELSLVALELLTNIMRGFHGNLTQKMRLVPHVMANFGIISTVHRLSHGLDDLGLELITVVGEFLRRLGRWEDEYQVQAFSFLTINEMAGRELPERLSSMDNLAEVLSCQGKYEQAEEMHRRTLDLMEPALGKEHTNTLMSMNNLADVLRHQGKYEEAEEMHQQTLKSKETGVRQRGSSHTDRHEQFERNYDNW